MIENPYVAPAANPLAPTNQPKALPKTVREVLFSFKGRISRRVFWAYSIGTIVAHGLLMILIFQTLLGTGMVYSYNTTFFALQLIAGWISLALFMKRWHDRSKSAWWNLLVVISLVEPLWRTLAYGPRHASSGDFTAWDLVTTLIFVFLIIECACLRGTVGPNKYGDDPA